MKQRRTRMRRSDAVGGAEIAYPCRFVARKAIVLPGRKCHPPSPYKARGLSTFPQIVFAGYPRPLSFTTAGGTATHGKATPAPPPAKRLQMNGLWPEITTNRHLLLLRQLNSRILSCPPPATDPGDRLRPRYTLSFPHTPCMLSFPRRRESSDNHGSWTRPGMIAIDVFIGRSDTYLPAIFSERGIT